MKYLFIINPKAGSKDATAYMLPKIKEFFEGKELDYDIAVTQNPGQATQLARQAVESGEEIRVCACGGDGTLLEVAEGLIGVDNAELAFCPCGSGNDYIKCFAERTRFEELEHVISASSSRVDVLKINDRHALNIVSAGLDADVTAGIPRFRRIPLCGGKMAYILSLLDKLIKPLGKPFTLEINGERISRDFLLIAFGNGRVYGGGFYATPLAELDDGLIDVVAVDKVPLSRAAGVVSVYKNGQHLKDGKVIDKLSDVVRFYRASSAVISSDEPFAFNLDGEVEMVTRVEISILPKALRFVTPEPN